MDEKIRRDRHLVTALAAAAAVLAASWLAGSVAVRSSLLVIPTRRRETRPPGRDFTLASHDGVRLAATYWPGAREDSPAVLIVHGMAASRRAIETNAEFLAGEGYAVLTIDLRGHGDSERATLSFGWHEARDTHAALSWLKTRQQGASVAAIGISMGGSALLVGPLGPVPAQAFVLQGVFATFRRTVRNRTSLVGGVALGWLYEPLLSFQTRPRLGVWPSRIAPRDMLAGVTCPVFVIGGEKDVFTPPDETRELYEAAAGEKQLWLAPGLGHNGVSDVASADYRARLRDFLNMAIGAP